MNYVLFKQRKDTPNKEKTDLIKDNVKNLSNLLKINGSSEDINVKFSKIDTNLWEKFLTIIEPSSYFERLYRETIYGPKSRLILLAFNVFKKSEDVFKLKAKKIYSKIASMIFKKYHNESIGNSEDISNIKGNKFVCTSMPSSSIRMYC